MALDSPLDNSILTQNDVTFTCTASHGAGLIDATLYVGTEARTVTFGGPSAMEDAMIRSDSPSSNFGAATSLKVDRQNPHAHTLLRVPNLLGSGPGQIPPGAAIESATLEVTCTNSGNTLKIYRLTESWVEGEATWQNRSAGVPWTVPGADGPGSNAGVALDGDCTATGLRVLDVTTHVGDWASGASNHGFVLIDSGNDGVDFSSSEGGSPPLLRITYRTRSWQAVETRPLAGSSASTSFTTTLPDGAGYIWNCLVRSALGTEGWAPAHFRLTVDSGGGN